MHLHIHIIPRFRDPAPVPLLTTGGIADPFLRHLLPLFSRATEISILAAFVQESGLQLLERHIFLALERGAKIQLVTGDYLNITQVAALTELLDWSAGNSVLTATDATRGTFEAKVVEVAKLPGPIRSFHPKSWRFEGADFGTAFVGSSNVSRAALGAGIEWNLRADRQRNPAAYAAVTAAFKQWWTRARPLTAEWIQDYAHRAKEETATPLPTGEEDADLIETSPPPHQIQLAALAALEKSRETGGQCRALVVLATGLGKTYLAALDVAAWAKTQGRLPRVLMLAHREELLLQAVKTFRRLLRDHAPRFGWFAGNSAELEGNIIFASVQKLSRPEHLDRLVPASFDYVIIDEVHHGTAPTYRSILDRLDPGFLLGLTATPERADGADVVGLFDDHVVYRADLGIGIEQKLLVPFLYYGLRDDVDYDSIPFHNRRFDPVELARTVDTDHRFEHAWRAWQEHPGKRTLVFCCSIAHADHTCQLLINKGVRVATVHSGPGSSPREDALDEFSQGKLDALCTVDLFNEGIDLPDVDRVVMLRPTESPVIFLQQVGRGLRVAGGKERLIILDFVGNHRIFLDRVRTLLSLGPSPTDLRDFLAGARQLHLPTGCSVEIEVEAKSLLQSLLPSRGKSEVERVYRDIRTARGTRPTAGELYRMGYRPSTLLPAYEGWFDFVATEKNLSPSEERTLATGKDWFHEFESIARPPRLAMIALEALLEAGALLDGLPVSNLNHRILALLLRSPDLRDDLVGGVAEPSHLSSLNLEPFMELVSWTKREHKWFMIQGDRVASKLPCPPGDEDAFVTMTRELVDYWFARDRARRRQDVAGASFVTKVLWNRRDPILKLPSRQNHPDLPSDETEVRLPSGELWLFRFMKEFCNVARPLGVHHNALPDLLRGWFGLAVGRPGTAFYVRFSRSPDGLWVEPDSSEVPIEAPRGLLAAFPTLRAAAGAALSSIELSPEASSVRLPVTARGEGLFAVRASGDSMEGGKHPIRDGDWLVMRFARGASREEIAGKIAVLQVPDADMGFAYQVKRVVRDGTRWVLRSDNPTHPSFAATADTVPIAVLVDVIRPEDISPRPGEKLDQDQVTAAFSLDTPPRSGRCDGHLFLCIQAPGALVAPDRIRAILDDRRPGETAFVLTRPPGEATWRYAGVARYHEEEGLWACPAVDYATYQALGTGRGSSRSLPSGARERSLAMLEALFRRYGEGATLERSGKRCRLLGRTREGGARIDGGPGGFAERTVSPTDLAWVLVASDDVHAGEGVLDELRVNRLRYIEGTPKGSTRWIDTGWALVLVTALEAQGEADGA
jgi:superfamily II DNA or RNA helicase/HKD family nuclease